MRREGPSSITVEEAVAEMVNMDYIPAGFTLLEMLEAFQEEAEVEYNNCRLNAFSGEQIRAMEIRMHVCQVRALLAADLLESLQHEVDHRDGSMIDFAAESFGKQRLTFESVSDWAADKYGIGIARPKQNPPKVNNSRENATWEEVTIKIWSDYKIGYSTEGGRFTRSHFRKIGLMGLARTGPNHLGLILIGLSQGKKFPPGNAQAKDKTAISKLRRILSRLTGLSKDPFMPYNEHEGWKPRFKLVDDRNNADERAERNARHVKYEDTDSHPTDIDD